MTAKRGVGAFLKGFGVVGAAGVLISEWFAWRASFDGLPAASSTSVQSPGSPSRLVVLVLGFRSARSGGVGRVQRWRVRIAMRSADPTAARFVFSGGSSSVGVSEAAVMATYAVEVLGLPAGRVELEEQSITTWENVAFSLPMLRDADAIVIASNTFHARRARRYLAMQAPELAERLRRGADHRFGEYLFLKPILWFYEVWRARSRGP